MNIIALSNLFTGFLAGPGPQIIKGRQKTGNRKQMTEDRERTRDEGRKAEGRRQKTEKAEEKREKS
jgi:hypothetical protein